MFEADAVLVWGDLEAEMAWTGGKAADLRALLSVATGRKPATGRGCWPGEDDRPDARPGGVKERRCWPDASDLPRGDISPADAIRKIARGGWI